MASISEPDLLLKLESASSTPIFSLFSDYLIPFIDLRNPKKPKSQNQARSLAKQFLTFLNRSISIIPKRLSDPSKLRTEDNKEIPKLALELLDTYRLCLDCLDLVASQLSCKGYTLNIQRLRFIYCLQTWALYKEGENEGFSILERIRVLDLGEKNKKKKNKRNGDFLPCMEKNVDMEFAKFVVEVVVAIVKCVALGHSKECGNYRRVLALVEEVRPWFRVLDANAYDKLHRVLVIYLGQCTQFVVGELTNFDGDTVNAFCKTSLNEYADSSLKDQIYKFARQLCSSLLLQEGRDSFIIDILKCVLGSLASKWQVKERNRVIEFVELVSYCANKYQSASTILCSSVAEHLNELAINFSQALEPMDMILRLYAIGLTINNGVAKSRSGDVKSCKNSKDEPAFSILIADGFLLGNLSPLLGSLRSYFFDGCNNCESCRVNSKDSACLFCSQLVYSSETQLVCTQKDRRVYLPEYFEALKFLSQPLSELINSAREQVVAENDVASFSTLKNIQEVFDQVSDVFVILHSTKSEREGCGLDGNKMILSIAVAAFTLSIRTKLKLQKCIHILKHIVASEWIQPQGLKYIFTSLYNLGVLLYRNKQLNEASKALKLSWRASWSRVVLLCQMFINKSINDLEEDGIMDFVMDTCERTAFLLDVLSQCGSLKVQKILVHSLECWSVAEDLFRKLPAPMRLLKQWVKTECRHHKNLNVDAKPPTLYHLLSSSTKFSKWTINKLLQQELLAYVEMDTMYPELCQRMQIEIIDVLLQDAYVTSDDCIERSRILILKGRALKACGFDGSEECIQCLSEAISVINSEKCSAGCHELAVAYGLRALCVEEIESNSKLVLQDIKAAIDIWSRIPIPDDGNIFSKSAVSLLYSIVDLLSIKGSMQFHLEIYKVMFEVFERKNVPLEKFLSILWENRRLSHALCVSPIYDELLKNIAGEFGEQVNSTDFWMLCLKGSLPSLIGFRLNFTYLFTSVTSGLCNHGNSFSSDATVDDVKQAAHDLISKVPVTSYSIFLAGGLYYDLCEKLIARGHLFEALSYAKEAHRLRSKLFQEKYIYSVEQRTEQQIEAGNHTERHIYLQVKNSIAREVWHFNTSSSNGEACYLSPWKVLQCYLESTLQVGTIHEIIGNGGEAETFLKWGKDISCQQSLSLFKVAFSTVLGKLYRKKRYWDLSEKELQNAKQTLGDKISIFSCLKCRLMLEASVDQQLADLSRNHFSNATWNASMQRLSLSESLYKSSLNKLNLSEWKNSTSCPEEVEHGIRSKFTCSTLTELDMMDSASTRTGPNAKVKERKCKQTKNATRCSVKKQASITERSTRLTRSRYRSSQNHNGNDTDEVQLSVSAHVNGDNEHNSSDTICKRKSLSEMKSNTSDFGCEFACVCNKMKCWYCLAREVKVSGSIISLISLKWELIRRQLLLSVLSGRGKCLELRGQIHDAHENILQSIRVLVSRNPFSQSHAPVSLSFLLDLVGREFSEDVFAIDRAALLYKICWFSLKCYHSKDNRTICCDLSCVQLQKIVSWLMLAFVLCREVPILFQKVSKLLSVIYILSSSNELFSLPSYCKLLSEAQWASYFHQASLGCHLMYQFFSSVTGKCKSEQLMVEQGFPLTSSTFKGAEPCNLARLVPKSPQDLEQFVTEFFSSIPCTTIICISLIGGPHATLLQELLAYPSHVHAWMLLSRLNFKSHPLVLLLPLDLIPKEVSDYEIASYGCGELSEGNDGGKHWHCPWGFTVIDEVAPAFKSILEENYLSSSISPSEDTKENRTLWWMRRKTLDSQLRKLLRKLEDLWLGPWRCVLLGEFSNCMHLDTVQNKLVQNLKSRCKLDVNENLLKIILGGGSYTLDREAFVSDLLFSRSGCFIGKALYSDENMSQRIGFQKLSDLAIQFLHEAVNELEEDSANREPMILVLDCEVQMLPWENLPVLRNQEVYRMPSVGSICLTLDRSCNHQDQVGRIIAAFPSIDPLDAFYLLNPSGDLSSTQFEFENWFRDEKLEGKAGCAPTAEELTSALKNHDLFLYFGHGSGAQYISQQEIQKLENCAASLLMGCSSGALTLNGSYIPQGAPISYLLAGSPIIIANLWEVTDKDIDRFGKAMLNAWLKERCSAAIDCVQCNLLAKEFEAMNLRDSKVGMRKKTQKKREAEGGDNDCCNHKPKIGFFMSQARDACRLPYLIGASPVCYGVPTGIRKKNL